MKLTKLRLLALASILVMVSSCQTIPTTSKRFSGMSNYDSPAYRPKNPDNVKVKVSLNEQKLYVMENNKPLLVTAICTGKIGKETPRGNFKIYKKIKEKRSGTYGFWRKGDTLVPGKNTKRPAGNGWQYVGYPMPYWCEFKPAYGFHGGYVWPQPRSSGCIRTHFNVAPKFYQLVKNGTPVSIAYSQPEDKKFGKFVSRPKDYGDPDPPAAIVASDKIFDFWDNKGVLFQDDASSYAMKKSNTNTKSSKPVTSNLKNFWQNLTAKNQRNNTAQKPNGTSPWNIFRSSPGN